MAGNDDDPPAVDILHATVDPLTAIHTSPIDTTGKSKSNMDWITHSFPLIATSTVTALSFGDLPIKRKGDACYGAAFDNVIAIAAAEPEPATMLLSGASRMGLTRKESSEEKNNLEISAPEDKGYSSLWGEKQPPFSPSSPFGRFQR
jgi:hypothetical protein